MLRTVLLASALMLAACGGEKAETAGGASKAVSSTSAKAPKVIDFGDDAGNWPNDGVCDDPRFKGPKSGEGMLAVDIGHDATDCRQAFEAELIARVYDPATVTAGDLNFGSDSSPFKNDGVCNDPRFGGPKSDPENTVPDDKMDASDCRALFEAGEVWLR